MVNDQRANKWYNNGVPFVSDEGPRTMSVDLSQFSHLSLPQKLELVEALWDDILASPERLPIPDWQMAELDRREAKLRANPDSVVTRDEAKRRIRSKDG